MSDEAKVIRNDGLYTPEIKKHSLEKIRLHNRYANIFSTSMSRKWPQRAYVGLYSGAGHASVAGTGTVVETSALAVVTQAVPFTSYIFVDKNPACIDALKRRVARTRPSLKATFIEADVNSSVAAVRRALPPFSKGNGLLCFCFVDPFDIQLRFDTIRQLSDLRMDFLVLMMLGVDARRNFSAYLNDESSTRIGDFIDCPNWRDDFKAPRKPIHFLLRKFDEAMVRVGYLSNIDQVHPVKVFGMGVLQYMLAFYSKSELAQRFWSDTRTSVSPQLGLQL